MFNENSAVASRDKWQRFLNTGQFGLRWQNHTFYFKTSVTMEGSLFIARPTTISRIQQATK